MRPDKKLAGAARAHRRRQHAGQRLHEGRQRRRPRAPASTARRCSTTAPPTATRSTARAPSRRCTPTRRPPRRTRPSRSATSAPPAARPRRSRTTSRARSSTRARATRRGRATSATAWAPLSIRPNDLFYGAKAGDVQPDWVDPDRFDVPQADEQQRLLANLITQMNLDKAPLPRFWYLPRGKKAASSSPATTTPSAGRRPYFDRLKTASPAGCSVADWECVRATSYAYPDTPMTHGPGQRLPGRRLRDRAAPQHRLPGLHARRRSRPLMTSQLGAFAATWPGLARRSRTARTASSGATGHRRPKAERRARHPLRHELLLQGPGRLGQRSPA